MIMFLCGVKVSKNATVSVCLLCVWCQQPLIHYNPQDSAQNIVGIYTKICLEAGSGKISLEIETQIYMSIHSIAIRCIQILCQHNLL